MQNQKKPIQQKKPMQNFTAEKWADKIALFIDNFGFLSGFFWHWTIALPSPTSHLAMLHSKIILSDPNRRVKVVLIGFSLFWGRCRTWGSIYSILSSKLTFKSWISTSEKRGPSCPNENFFFHWGLPLDGGITPDVWLIKVHTYITFESTESMLSFEMTLAQQRLGDHPIHLDIHFGQYFHLKILLGAIK